MALFTSTAEMEKKLDGCREGDAEDREESTGSEDGVESLEDQYSSAESSGPPSEDGGASAGFFEGVFG